MKTRQLEILKFIMHNTSVSVFQIVDLYEISKRTLYYDIEELNNLIVGYGRIRILDNKMIFEGDAVLLSNNLEAKLLVPYYQALERQNIMLLSILEEKNLSLDNYSEKFQVSRTTVFTDVEMIRANLKDDEVRLYYDKKYRLKGNEWKIRDLYLSLLSLKTFDYQAISPAIISFNQKYDLYLSDYSMFYLSQFIEFIKKRIKSNNILKESEFMILKKSKANEKWDLSKFIESDNKFELKYLSVYILSLSALKNSKTSKMVTAYVDVLLKAIDQRLALSITWDQSFKLSLQNHLLSSYHRIKYSFPALNPTLNDIKMNYFTLFYGIKKIIRDLNNFEYFYNMREEEIAFVTAYIGGYILRRARSEQRLKRVIIVCPQGSAVSNNLKYQIENFISNVEVVGGYSLDQLGTMVDDYDFIVSTIALPNHNNVIKVNPILSDLDRQVLIKKLSSTVLKDDKDFSDLLEIIKANTKIVNMENLEIQLRNFLKGKKIYKKGYEPMLKELLSLERINRVESVKDWQEAIRVASKPLLEDKSIMPNYIEAMIDSVNKFGPYIVLADEFALPHASGDSGVNKLAMSMLVLDKEVDMLGKDVKIFLVLASPDNKSHLKALASLTDIMSDEENLEYIKVASREKILELIRVKEVDKWKF